MHDKADVVLPVRMLGQKVKEEDLIKSMLYEKKVTGTKSMLETFIERADMIDERGRE
jgi:hypothetical protein